MKRHPIVGEKICISVVGEDKQEIHIVKAVGPYSLVGARTILACGGAWDSRVLQVPSNDVSHLCRECSNAQSRSTTS